MVALREVMIPTDGIMLLDAPLALSVGYPARYAVDSEVILVVGGNGTAAVSVVRGVESTTIASHAKGAPLIFAPDTSGTGTSGALKQNFDIRDYGALGDGSDDGPAFRLAVAAASPNGTVFVPLGHWRIQSQVPLGAVSLTGVGQSSWIDCVWMGNGVAAFVTGPTTTGREQEWPTISKLLVTGPVGRALGVRGSLVDGFLVSGAVQPTFRDVTISNFDRGMVWNGLVGHIYLNRATVTNCYYGIYQSHSSGDSFITDSLINGNTFANIACPADQGFDGLVIERTHLGFAPYGIYQEAAPHTQGNKNFLSGVILRHARFESIGNAAIYTGADETAPNISAAQDLLIEHPGFSWDTNYRIAELDHDYAVRLGYVAKRITVVGGIFPFSAGAVNVFRVGYGAFTAFELIGDSALTTQVSIAAGTGLPTAGSGHLLAGGPAVMSSLTFGTYLFNSALKILYGAGSPEGAAAAMRGSLYLRNDGGAGTSLYVKETDSGAWWAPGNTGWAAK